MKAERRARWAISFADLALLLLGFFVLLQASGSRSTAILSGVGRQFGARPSTSMDNAQDIAASALFAPGEAMLTPAGKSRISAVGRQFAVRGGKVELASAGQDPGAHRFDAWDLAAARLGAVARTLREAGIREDQLVIRGLDQAMEGSGHQTIRIAPARSGLR